jgi:hypothetical protein
MASESGFPVFEPARTVVAAGIAVGVCAASALLRARLARSGRLNPGLAGWTSVLEAAALAVGLGMTGLLGYFGAFVSLPAVRRVIENGANGKAVAPLMGGIVLAAHNVATGGEWPTPVLAQCALAMALPFVFRRPPLPVVEPVASQAPAESDEQLRERFRALREHSQGLERRGWRDRLVVRLLDGVQSRPDRPEAAWAETLRESLSAGGILLFVRGRRAWAGDVPREWRAAPSSLPDPESAVVENGVAQYAGHAALHAQASLADGTAAHVFVPWAGEGATVLQGQLARAAAALARVALPGVLGFATVPDEAPMAPVAEPPSGVEAAALQLAAMRRRWGVDTLALLVAAPGGVEVELSVGTSLDWSFLDASALGSGALHSPGAEAPWIHAAQALRRKVGSVAVAPSGPGRWLAAVSRERGAVTKEMANELLFVGRALSPSAPMLGKIVDAAEFAARCASGPCVLVTLGGNSEGLAPAVAEALPPGSLVAIHPGAGLVASIAGTPDDALAWITGPAAAQIAQIAGADWAWGELSAA